MMPEITDQSIRDRFVEVLLLHLTRGDKCKFYQKYGIQRTNIQRLIRERGNLMPRPSWLAAVVVEFGISPTWLLTGEGEMMG
jgi:hypothetical protein